MFFTIVFLLNMCYTYFIFYKSWNNFYYIINITFKFILKGGECIMPAKKRKVAKKKVAKKKPAKRKVAKKRKR